MAERKALVANASSAKQTRKAEAFERLLHRQFNDSLATVLETDAGVIVLHYLLHSWSAWKTVFSSDPLVMAKNAGQQDVAHRLMMAIDDAREDGMARITDRQQYVYRERVRVAGQRDETIDEDDNA